MHKVALYGKGGIGKSTTACNLSAALAETGARVLQIGCDPKADSTRLLTGRRIPTVLDLMRSGRDIALEDVVVPSRSGVLCAEAGGPVPGMGCAGRGISSAFELLDELGALEEYRPDVVVYDVLGDVVCGGFSMPMRPGRADEVLVVTSGEMMALYAAGNIVQALDNLAPRGYARMGGVVLNRRNVAGEDERVAAFCSEHDTRVVCDIPRSQTVQDAEAIPSTVIEAFGSSSAAEPYRDLARTLLERAGA